jgi:hypothetical protein
MGLPFTVAAGLARAVVLGSESRGTHDHILLSQIRDSQPGGAGPRIYIPQEHGGPVITPESGFPFRRLLRLAVLRWRYSNPRPQRKTTFSSKSTVVTEVFNSSLL